jgi:hypothetical protein
MSVRCSPASAAWTSGWSAPGCGSSGSPRSTRTPAACWRSTGRTSPTSATSPRSTGAPLNDPMSSAAATPASRSASPESDEANRTPVTFGRTSIEPFAIYDPDTHSWRTCPAISLWGSTPFSETWPRSGTTSSGAAFRRRQSVRLTSDGESSLLHTPTAKANQASPSMRSRDPGSWFPTPSATSYGSSNQSPSSGAAVRPSLETMARRGMWPTPRTPTGGRTVRLRTRPGRKVSTNLEERLAEEEPASIGGQLNPTWVEWLMGFPLGYTEVD